MTPPREPSEPSSIDSRPRRARRLGCIAGDVLVELPLDLDVVIVDTPGAPTDDRVPEGEFDDDISRASSDEWSVPVQRLRLVATLAYAPMDILLGLLRRTPRSFRRFARR